MYEDTNILSLDDLRKQRKPIENSYDVHRQNLSFVEKFAYWITVKVGSMGFFMILFVWTLVWLAWNTFAPDSAKFDPFPGFVLWLFISNMLQLLLLPLIMIGQNLEQRYSDIRSRADFEVNQKAEREIETVIQHLERQGKMLKEMKQQLAELQKNQ